jgi:hypothetical protein
MARRTAAALASAACLFAAACSGAGDSASDSAAGNNVISEDPFGATGAPGADMTDNGVTDGGSDLPADNGAVNLAEPGNAAQ